MPEIQKIRYTHDACIDMILAQPEVSQNELAERFGFSPSWVSIVVNSDAFQARLGERRKELVDPVIAMALEERMRGLASRSIEVLMEMMQDSGSAKAGATAIKALPIATAALGLNATRETRAPTNLYIVQAPARAKTSEEWSGRVLEMQTVQKLGD
jgi:hypothetical protein